MKSSKLIQLIRKADPIGNIDVTIGNSPVYAVERLPSYYDGRKLEVFPDDCYPTSARLTAGGYKIRLTPIDLETLIMDNSEFPVEQDGDYYDRKRIEALRAESRQIDREIAEHEAGRPLPFEGAPRWISTEKSLPAFDRPVLLWGTALESDDFAVLGRLCSCHERWIVDSDDFDDNASETHTESLLGTVTHWLGYGPPAGKESS